MRPGRVLELQHWLLFAMRAALPEPSARPSRGEGEVGKSGGLQTTPTNNARSLPRIATNFHGPRNPFRAAFRLYLERRARRIVALVLAIHAGGLSARVGE